MTREKQRLIFLLERERRKTVDLLRDVDPRLVVHPDSGWRIMDVLAHLAAWEREVLASVQAFDEGDACSIADYDLERYNQAQYERRRGLDPAQVRMDWGMVRRDIQDVVHDLKAHCFDVEMTYPSGRLGRVVPLIEELAAHEAEHREQVALAIAGHRADDAVRGSTL
ncbi:MAG: DinB family protein [Chloroflexota bacterium]|nr:DinB family protein [Chloroflexota bacterium]